MNFKCENYRSVKMNEKTQLLDDSLNKKSDYKNIFLNLYSIYVLILLSVNSVFHFMTRFFLNTAAPAIQKEMNVLFITIQ